MKHRKYQLRWLVALLTVGLLAAACSGTADDADEAVEVVGELAGVCPSPLVVQTDWFPESEHGALYHLIGDDYTVDTENQTVQGSMVLDGTDLGIEFQVRTGGPAIGFAPVSSYMYTDDSIHLGYASTDAQILQYADAPLIAVVAPLEQNPQMIMWDPETYPNVNSIADLGREGIPISIFPGGVFSRVFVAQGIWSEDQIDPSYEGNPSKYVSQGGSIAQQGFASSEVYTYEHLVENWLKPVNFQLLHDAGFQIYSQTIGVRPRDMESLRPCLEKVVPIIQQAVVSYDASPDRGNEIIVDAVLQYDSFWVYPPDLADFSVRAQREFGLIGNGPDSTVGNMEADRIQSVLDAILATDLAADVADGLSAEDIFTNEFIDESIGFEATAATALDEMPDDEATMPDDGETMPDDGETMPDDGETMPDDGEMMAHLGDGSLGVVEVEAGDAVQIRSLEAITGDVAFFGLPIDRATQIAVDDYGQIHDFDVDTGTSLDDTCSNDGGQAAAQIIVADEDVVGVIGTSCSGAAVAAAPLITDAGMVLISGGNTSPALTSDLAGNAGPNYSVGYYRTAHNDLYQGAAMAKFVFSELGITEAAAIHDGDPYTQGLAQAFADAFEREGGTVTGFTAVNKDDTDMVPALTEIAAGSPEALFFPIFQPAGDFIADQAPRVSGLEETVLLAADGLLNTNYLSLPQTARMYFSGPDQRFGENVSESTGKSAVDFLTTYEELYGEAPAAPFWAHGYDATVMLLDAIAAASWVEDGNLMIDRQGIRDHLNSISGYSGLIGTLSCDDFGDCGSAKITVVRNLGGEENAEASLNNVVFSYAP